MPPDLVQRVEELGDLELALLLSFVANEHCLIQTEIEGLDSLQQELQLVRTVIHLHSIFSLSSHQIVSNIYRRSCVVIECSEKTDLDDFIDGLMLDVPSADEPTAKKSVNNADTIEVLKPGRSGADVPSKSSTDLKEPRIADVVVLRNINRANYDIQIQALELIRTKRVFTRTSFVMAPKDFCMVIIQSPEGPHLNKHLNDHIFLSHFHGLEDGFPNLENASEWIEDDRSSSSSVVRKPVLQNPYIGLSVTFSEAEIQALVTASKNTTVTAEVECYLHDIVTFLRMHRAVDGGINPMATKCFQSLVRCLAPLHGLDYVTPSLVAIAARKIYPHRIILTIPERDRSLQYGSDLAAVRAALEGVTPESIIEDVLVSVEAPL
ncbi:MAG: hypothetical protein Q9209_004940 [Squamulea sp. 1 TL-2023]